MTLELRCMMDILLAGILGFLIGLERKFRSKEAGIRTHTIVCVASALFMVVSKYAFGDNQEFDPARVAAQIIPGIGFLGAGIIVYKKNVIHGLTTAAGVWATAGVGMACGGGLYVIASLTAALLIAFQFLFHTKRGIFAYKKQYRLNISFYKYENEDAIIKEVFDVLHFYRFNAKRIGDDVVCEVTLFTESAYTSERLNEYMKEYPFIISIQRVDEE